MGFWGKMAGMGSMLGGGALMATGVGGPAGAALAGIGAGITKRELLDKPKEQAQQRLAVDTQRLSPWTGLQANLPQQGSYFDNGFQGGMTGLTLAQALGKGEAAAEKPTHSEANTGLSSTLDGDTGPSFWQDRMKELQKSNNLWARPPQAPVV